MADERMVLCQTLANNAVTQFTGFDFNSFARAHGRDYGFSSDGMYLLGGDTDAGESIDAHFEIYVDLGQTMRPRSLWIGYETAGTLRATLTVDDRTADAQTFMLTPILTGNRQHGARFPLCPHRDKGQYFRLRIANVDGCDFSIDDITMLAIPLGRRREGR